MLTEMNRYLDRIIDKELNELGALPALAIEGPKGVGKTETAKRRARTVVRLDDPEKRELAAADPTAALTGPGPVLLDEWQHVPAIWDAVKRAVDDGNPPGPFFLTGSATPASGLYRQRHSGAARIDVVRMRPMALTERVAIQPTVSFTELLAGGATSIGGSTDFSLDDYTNEIICSGFPAIRKLSGRALRTRLEGYISRIIDRDIEDELRQKIRRPATLRNWMTAYAAATATTTTLEKIREAAAPGEKPPIRQTVISYRDALSRLFILDPVEGWAPTNNHLRRLAQAPKHHLTDPALAVSLLGLTKEKLLKGEGGIDLIPRDGVFLGALFESLATQVVRVLAQASEANVFHLRTRNGNHEVDLIVEGPSGAIVAIEVKLSQTVSDADCRHLNWLRDTLKGRPVERVVITTGEHAYRRLDGVCVVPLVLLGA